MLYKGNQVQIFDKRTKTLYEKDGQTVFTLARDTNFSKMFFFIKEVDNTSFYNKKYYRAIKA